MKLTAIAFRNIARNRRRSILSGTAIALATFAIVFMFSMIGGMKGEVAKNAYIFESGHIRIRHAEFDKYENLNPLHLGVPDYHNVVSEVEKVENVRLVLPRIRFFSAIYREKESYKGMGLSVDFARESRLDVRRATRDPNAPSFESLDRQGKLAAFAEAWELSGYEGRLPENGQREILLSTGLAEEMSVSVGDKVTFYTKTAYMGMQAWTFKVTGLVQFPVVAMNKSYFLAPLDSAQRFLKMDAVGDSVTDVMIHIDELDQATKTAAAVGDALQARGHKDLTVQPWKEIGMLYAWMEMAEQIYSVIALFFFVLGSTVIINTTMMVIFERMKEIGTISAMGMTGGEITRLFFLEAFFISLMAAFIGVALGSALTIPLSIYGMDYGESISGTDFAISPIIYPQLSLRSTVFVFFYSVAIASVASFLPTRKAAKIEPVEALRTI